MRDVDLPACARYAEAINRCANVSRRYRHLGFATRGFGYIGGAHTTTAGPASVCPYPRVRAPAYWRTGADSIRTRRLVTYATFAARFTRESGAKAE